MIVAETPDARPILHETSRTAPAVEAAVKAVPRCLPVVPGP